MARFRTSFLAFFQYGNLPIVFVAAGSLGATPLWFAFPASYPLMIAGSAGAFLLYQIDRAWHVSPEDVYNQPERLAWVRSHRPLTLAFLLIALGAIVFASPYLKPATFRAGVALGFAGFVYLLPILPGRNRPKGHWLIKPLSICGAWSIGVVVLPALEAGFPLDGHLAVLLLYRFLFFLPNVVLADWPDRDGDRREGLLSVAITLGEHRLRRLAQAASLASLAVGGVLAWRLGWPSPAMIDLAGPALMLIAIARPLPASRWFFAVWLDLLLAWPLIAVLVASISG
jgi:4-hydroxybenzoate polyprenyltransferase